MIDKAVTALIDLAEISTLGDHKKLGDTIVSVLQECLQSQGTGRNSLGTHAREQIEELLSSRQRLQWEKSMPKEDLQIKQAAALVVKLEGNSLFSSGNIAGAASKYSEALALCPMRSKKERVVLYSNRAQCHLLLQQPLAAISDATRALCLHNPVNRHAKSLWRRAQAYDMLGLAKESLLDAILFINECSQSNDPDLSMRQNKVPDYAERLVKKQMRAAWLFREAAVKHGGVHCDGGAGDIYGQEGDDSEWETASESDIGNDGRGDMGDDDSEWKNDDDRKDKYEKPSMKGIHFFYILTFGGNTCKFIKLRRMFSHFVIVGTFHCLLLLTSCLPFKYSIVLYHYLPKKKYLRCHWESGLTVLGLLLGPGPASRVWERCGLVACRLDPLVYGARSRQIYT